MAVPIFDLALALGGVGIFPLQFLKVAVIFFHHRVAVDEHGVTAQMIVERESLAVMKGKTGGVERVT